MKQYCSAKVSIRCWSSFYKKIICILHPNFVATVRMSRQLVKHCLLNTRIKKHIEQKAHNLENKTYFFINLDLGQKSHIELQSIS